MQSLRESGSTVTPPDAIWASVSSWEEHSPRPRPASGTSPALPTHAGPASLGIYPLSRFFALRTLPLASPVERRRRRAGWLPGIRRSPSANVLALVRAEEPSRVLHSSPFPSGALVPCHRSSALCSDLVLTWTWQVDSHLLEEMGSGGQGATGRRPDNMPQAMGDRWAMGSQSGHCHPDVPGEVEGVAQVHPQRPEGGLHTATQLLRA